MFLLYQIFIKPEIRLNLIKNEIKRNLPEVNIDPKALYIHIRSGNIFKFNIQSSYAQPPLCFYQKILYNFNFSKIYIISIDKTNPVINKLLEEFPNIIFNKNNFKIDISYLVNGYNLVASVSSFFTESIKFNDNLKNCWEYDIYRKSEKFRHLHYEFYDFPIKYKIFLMKPSQNYKNEMFKMENTPKQILLMTEEKCINDFVIYEP